jgi:hypothetical protein
MIVRDLEQQDCIECGCVFGVPGGFTAQRRSDNRTFYCPNGHRMSYHENETDKLRRERDRLAQRIAEKDDEIKRQRELREGTERQLTATRAVVTRIKNRVGKGVCPCCNRTFENLHRHMTSKHPTYAAEAAE